MKTTKIYTEDKRVNKAINFFINKIAENVLGVGVEVTPDSFYYIDDYICEIRFEVYDPFINEAKCVHSRWCLSKDARRKPQFLTFI
jgi:hypothetical protein